MLAGFLCGERTSPDGSHRGATSKAKFWIKKGLKSNTKRNKIKIGVLDEFRLLARRKIEKKITAAAIPAHPWTTLRIDGTIGAETSQKAAATKKHGKKIRYFQRLRSVIAAFISIQLTSRPGNPLPGAPLRLRLRFVATLRLRLRADSGLSSAVLFAVEFHDEACVHPMIVTPNEKLVTEATIRFGNRD